MSIRSVLIGWNIKKDKPNVIGFPTTIHDQYVSGYIIFKIF